MKKNYKDFDVKVLFGWVLMVSLMIGMVHKHDKSLHKTYEPGYFLGKHKKEQVDQLRDSVLEQQVIRYGLLRGDFQKAYETCRRGEYKYNNPEKERLYVDFSAQLPFDSTKNVRPVFAKQYGVKNIIEYDNLLTQCEDSIDARYRELCLKYISPKVALKQKTR